MTKKLSAHGLLRLGTWTKGAYASVAHLRDQCPFGIAFELPQEWRTKHNVVYAFVIGDAVRYVGETTRGMTSRFEGYRYGNPAPLDTDNRVKLAITRALGNDEEVSIWAGQPMASLSLPNGEVLSIPACKPLEEHLIHRFQPDLNVKRIFRLNAVS